MSIIVVSRVSIFVSVGPVLTRGFGEAGKSYGRTKEEKGCFREGFGVMTFGAAAAAAVLAPESLPRPPLGRRLALCRLSLLRRQWVW